MIITKETKIEITNDITSDHIENLLKLMNYDVLKWAITGVNDNFYILNIAVIE